MDSGDTEVRLAVSFPDVDKVLKFDKNGDELITKDEMAIVLQDLGNLVEKEFQMHYDGKQIAPIEVRPLREESYFEVHLKYPGTPEKELKTLSPIIRRFTPDHQQLISVITGANEVIADKLLLQGSEEFNYTLVASASKAVGGGTSERFFLFLKRGIEHILTGYDHLLFLFALLVMCETFWSVAKIVTCFTVAHSITLGLATLDVVDMPSSIVEPMIAATIVFVGIENLFKLKTLQWRWLLTFTFGLIHGFGFAGMLKEMKIGSGPQVVVPLLSFNLGVEIGQILIAAIVLPILWQLRRLPQFAPKWIPVSSVIVVILGGYWLIDRVWGS